MFSMCSELTPRAHVPDNRIPQLMQPCHSGEKPYKCNNCDYASAWAGDLKKHLKTHSGEKPYKCNHCDYASVQTGNLKRHLKTHSGVKS